MFISCFLCCPTRIWISRVPFVFSSLYSISLVIPSITKTSQPLTLISASRFSTMTEKKSNFLIIFLLLLSASVEARKFHSRDAYVREAIAFCEGNISAPAPITDGGQCQPMLKCILNTVDSATQARWSAGASILAFIPAIAAMMSNSIDDVVLVSEESGLLALALCLCSFTVFSPRFGGERSRHESTAAIKEEIRHRIKRTYEKPVPPANRRHLRWSHRDVLGAILALLVACCALIWYPTVMILRNGVVVFSCEPQVHIPICESY